MFFKKWRRQIYEKLEAEVWLGLSSLMDEVEKKKSAAHDELNALVDDLTSARSDFEEEKSKIERAEKDLLSEMTIIERHKKDNADLLARLEEERKRLDSELQFLSGRKLEEIYFSGFSTGVSKNFDMLFSMQKDIFTKMLQKAEERVLQATTDRFKTVLRNHKQRVDHAASPYIVDLYDRIKADLQAAQQIGQNDAVKKYKDQLEVIEELMNVK